MGNSICAHTQKELIRTLGQKKWTFCTSSYSDYRCLDCNEVLRIEKMYSKLLEYSNVEIIHDGTSACDHMLYFIDVETLTVSYFDTGIEGDINLTDGKKVCCNVANAECAYCPAKFQVRCGFKETDNGLIPSENWQKT